MNLTTDQRLANVFNAWKPKRRDPEFFYKMNDEVFSFMISRHPFERILSAYRYE